MLNPQEIHSHLEEHLPQYLDLLKSMVAINSFTSNPAGVNKLGDLTTEVFAPLGFQAQRVQARNPEFGKHLILTRPGKSDLRIGLISHLDTVFPPEEEIENDFRWREEGDRIYGPGANDIKGGTVMIYMIMDALRAAAPDILDEITWMIMLNAAEERLSDEFGDLCLEHLTRNALAALVFEAGMRGDGFFQLVTARKGRATYTVTVQGKGAHAGSNHPEGANAIVQIAHTIQQIAALTDYSKHLTFNVGAVSGGSVVNRVPHYAEARVEMRAFDPHVFDAGVKNILALQNQVEVSNANGNYNCKVNIELDNRTAPWPTNPGTEKLLTIWQEAAAQLGISVLREERGGLSDGNFLWHSIPTIDGLGPYGINAHCSERDPKTGKEPEFVSRSSFAPKALSNVMAILKLIEGARHKNGQKRHSIPEKFPKKGCAQGA
ncbi:MAG: M20 family metallopeptidase [Chloroflexi bacterium]|nr:M20 family metallopeptidase [Chloroflexota bacterium]